MDLNILIGVLLVAGALILISLLTFYGRNNINRLAKLDYPSARDYLKDKHGGR